MILTFTYDLDFQSPAATVMTPTHMQKFKVNGQSVLEWKHTDRQTDGGDHITGLVNVIGSDNGNRTTGS